LDTEIKKKRGSFLGKIIAIIAIANLLLGLFNLSYISLRDFYFRNVPILVEYYDPVKSIEPNLDTERYLERVDRAKKVILERGINDSKDIFIELQEESKNLIEENPFLVANKYGTFAKLQRRIEYRMETSSAKVAFTKFWSPEYFNQIGATEAFNFFDDKIKPLLEVNYYRNIDENGQFIDYYWTIDLYFILFFALELLVTSFWYARKQPGINWGDAILRRWYDLLMLLPVWRWLRIIPVTVRIHKSGLLNTERILAQITYEPAAYLADRVSMFLMVRLVNQTQEAVNTGEAAKALLNPSEEEYINVGHPDKIDLITDRLIKLSIYKVLPQVEPDLEALLHHSLKEAFKDSDFYKTIQRVPGIKAIPSELTENIADSLSEGVYEVLASSYSDLKGRELFDNLTDHFRIALRKELRNPQVQTELQSLLSDLLEELKINYIQGATKQDPEETLAEADQLLQLTTQTEEPKN